MNPELLTLYITADNKMLSMVNEQPMIAATASQRHRQTTSMTMLTRIVVMTMTATTTTPAQRRPQSELRRSYICALCGCVTLQM